MGEAVSIDLADDERSLLLAGVAEWSGPARPNNDLARAMGFDDTDAISDSSDRLIRLLTQHKPMTSSEWAQVLLLTEIVFASDYYGSGLYWEGNTDLDDDVTIRRLRDVQRKLAGTAKL